MDDARRCSSITALVSSASRVARASMASLPRSCLWTALRRRIGNCQICVELESSEPPA